MSLEVQIVATCTTIPSGPMCISNPLDIGHRVGIGNSS